jgi:hypothetical protein
VIDRVHAVKFATHTILGPDPPQELPSGSSAWDPPRPNHDIIGYLLSLPRGITRPAWAGLYSTRSARRAWCPPAGLAGPAPLSGRRVRNAAGFAARCSPANAPCLLPQTGDDEPDDESNDGGAPVAVLRPLAHAGGGAAVVGAPRPCATGRRPAPTTRAAARRGWCIELRMRVHRAQPLRPRRSAR